MTDRYTYIPRSNWEIRSITALALMFTMNSDKQTTSGSIGSRSPIPITEHLREGLEFGLIITDLSITQVNESEIGINFCTDGAPVGTTLRVSVQDPDSQLHILKELGVPCFDKVNRPIWNIRDLAPGQYQIIGEARPLEANGDWNHPSTKSASIPFTLP